MAVDASIKVKGIEELQEWLMQKRDAFVRFFEQRLLQLAEDAVTYSQVNKGYKDKTSNLKNSISFALYLDGALIMMHEGAIPQPDAVDGGQSKVQEALVTYAQQEGVVAPHGYSLLIVAGMSYGVHVEHKGYNVLYLTKYFIRDEMATFMQEAIKIFS